ncbi:MAG: hypothetical protein ACE5QV_02950 [Fidelibacterota bacterium]
MKKLFIKITITVCIILIHSISKGAFEHIGTGARSAALNSAYSAVYGDIFSIFYNPAGIAVAGWVQFSMFYNSLFEIKELKYRGTAGLLPLAFATIGFGYTSYGNALYQENSFTLSAGKRIFRGLLLGINLSWKELKIKNYGSAGAPGIDAGIITELSNNLSWGLYLKNINSPVIGKSREKLPQIYSTGFSYSPTEEIMINLDLYKDILFPFQLRMGVEYNLRKIAAVRFGAGRDPGIFSTGLGLNYRGIDMNYSLSLHSELGISHQFSMGLRF